MTHLLQAAVINFSISVFIWAFDTAAALHSSQRAAEQGNSNAERQSFSVSHLQEPESIKVNKWYVFIYLEQAFIEPLHLTTFLH